MDGEGKEAYFAFGRFQPPTKGHKAMVKAMTDAAAKTGADVYIYVSSTCDLKAPLAECTNPLTVEERINIMKKQYIDLDPLPIIVNTEVAGIPNPFKAAQDLLFNKMYKKITLFAGADRVPGYVRMAKLISSNDKIKVKALNRNAIKVAGKGVSGTQMRLAALSDNLETMREGIITGNVLNANIRNLATRIRESNATRKAAFNSTRVLGKGKRSRTSSETAAEIFTRNIRPKISQTRKASQKKKP